MTEVPGPDGPPVRPSSFAIRGTGAQPPDAVKGSMIDDKVGMLRYSKFRKTTPACRRFRKTIGFRCGVLDRGFRLAMAVSPDLQREYGTAPGLLQACSGSREPPRRGLIPGAEHIQG